MYLISTEGKILYEGRFTTIKKGVEAAIADSVPLPKINLRQANLMGADMDGVIMPEACLWGANLNSANMGDGDFSGSDFRTATLAGSCLAESLCFGADFSGTYFSRTIVREADLSNCQFSCPSVFSIDLGEAKILAGSIYSHLGEENCAMSHAPLVIKGLPQTLIFMDDAALVGTKLIKITLREEILHSILQPIENINIKQYEQLSG